MCKVGLVHSFFRTVYKEIALFIPQATKAAVKALGMIVRVELYAYLMLAYKTTP